MSLQLIIYGSNLAFIRKMRCVEVAESKQGFAEATKTDLPSKELLICLYIKNETKQFNFTQSVYIMLLSET